MPDIPVLSNDPSVNIALDTIKKGKQALIFVNTKRGAEKTAEDIAKKTKDHHESWQGLSEQALHLPSPTKQCRRLSECLKKGIAFHHSGLTAKQRELIEKNFRKGSIRIIAATPTLAAGLDLPAYRSVIRDLKRYTGRGMSWIPVLEYLQMAGRAGRPKFDKEGEAIIIAASEVERDALTEHYIKGEPEDIYSKLAVEPALRTYLLMLIASRMITTEEEMRSFFSKTFWAHQYKDMGRLTEILQRMVRLLEEYEFIVSTGEFISANEVGKMHATPLGRRVAELYLDPVTAHHLIICMRKAELTTTQTFSYLHMVANTLEMRPLLNVKTKEWSDVQEKLVQTEGYLLQSEPSMYEDDYTPFLNSLKTAMFLEDWCEEKNEEYLLEQYDIRPGEIRAKLDIADWLCFASSELATILILQKQVKNLAKVRFRLKYGAKEELFSLLKLKNIGRVRARLLYNNGIKNVPDVKKADLSMLARVLGKAVAEDIHKQVGLDHLPVKENKRKGQINLQDYGE